MKHRFIRFDEQNDIAIVDKFDKDGEWHEDPKDENHPDAKVCNICKDKGFHTNWNFKGWDDFGDPRFVKPILTQIYPHHHIFHCHICGMKTAKQPHKH